MSDDITELQKEWRAIVIAELTSVKNMIENLRNDIVGVKTTVAQAAEVQHLRQKVESLEQFKAKLIGIIIAVTTVVNIVGWFITNK